MTPSVEGLPTKAKETTSSNEVRLAPLDTKPVFKVSGEKLSLLCPLSKFSKCHEKDFKWFLNPGIDKRSSFWVKWTQEWTVKLPIFYHQLKHKLRKVHVFIVKLMAFDWKIFLQVIDGVNLSALHNISWKGPILDSKLVWMQFSTWQSSTLFLNWAN